MRWPCLEFRGSDSTLGQLTYAGEWHSHPRRAAVRPSGDDFQAYAWLTSYMHAETLPGIMLIIGDCRRLCLVAAEPGATKTACKV
jgi:hypothetical protein